MTFFKRWAPGAKPRRNFTREDRFRGSPRERGYDADWDAYARGYKRAHPFCIECGHRGRVETATVVDHKIPVRLREDLFWEPSNHWALCSACHGWKYRLERYAEASNKVSDLILWCDEPDQRPKPFRAGVDQRK